MTQAVIVAAARTAIGRSSGTLARRPAPEPDAIAIGEGIDGKASAEALAAPKPHSTSTTARRWP